jgi:hypothetical protein
LINDATETLVARIADVALDQGRPTRSDAAIAREIFYFPLLPFSFLLFPFSFHFEGSWVLPDEVWKEKFLPPWG